MVAITYRLDPWRLCEGRIMKSYELAIGHELIGAFCEALGEDASLTQRIIIDIEVDTIATIHIQKFADKRIFEILPAIAKGATITIKGVEE